MEGLLSTGPTMSSSHTYFFLNDALEEYTHLSLKQNLNSETVFVFQCIKRGIFLEFMETS